MMAANSSASYQLAQHPCFFIHVNRAELGLAEERLRDYWEGQRRELSVAAILFVGIYDGTYLDNNYKN